MSGNYVQRGLPAMWDKFTRAEAALACGADLVLELPITGVLQSAEGFARTGVEILSRMGNVDSISFGAECGSAEALMALAIRLDNPDTQLQLREGLDRGLPYAAARQSAAGDEDDLLRSPNNILGLEYCRAILHFNSRLMPLAIQRNGDYHAGTADPQEPSATAVRMLFPNDCWQNYVPAAAIPLFAQAASYKLEHGHRAMLARLRALSEEEWETCAHGSEGLWSKAMKAARSQPDYEAIIDTVKSKRYPRTRIQRLLLCAYLGISGQDLRQTFPYVRILAAGKKGREILQQAKKNGNLNLVNPGEMPPDKAYYRLECRCSDLYTLFSQPDQPAFCQREQTGRIILND